MSKWIDFTIDERKAMIQAVSEEKQIDEASAEKDWWVTAVLYAIFHTSIGDNDVLDENGEPLKVPHDKDPSVIFVKYPSLYQSNAAYATPTVKIEISVLSMAEPFEMRRISSLVEQAFDGEDVDSDLVQTIRTVTPARTFLEKAFLLCEEYQKVEPRTHRMTRHFYDLEKLMQTPYAEMAFNDVALYEDIVNHRRKFYHVGYVDYDKELPQNIQIVPSDALLSNYEADYNEMRGSFIYGDSLDFPALMKRMAELQERFRKISILL